MDAVTYPNPAVEDFINRNDHLVPLMLGHDSEPQAGRYHLRWTPYLLVLDTEGYVVQRAVGWQSPAELPAWLALGAGKLSFDAADWPAARQRLESALVAYPHSHAAAETMYLGAVAAFHVTEDPSHLKQVHEDIKDRYPRSLWEMRTWPYSKL